jgi:hypothetical protein
MASQNITVTGKVAKVSAQDAARLAVFVVRCNQVLTKALVQADGSYRLNLARAALKAKSTHGLSLALAPATAGDHLDHLPEVPRFALDIKKLDDLDEYRAPEFSVSEAILNIWWLWCRWYCVSGRVVGPDGCAAPGAEVTVYTVTYSGSGYSKYARNTVTTAADGTFTICFEWCTCSFCFPCWPCYPIWWECWPWWWDFDILRVIDVIEQQPPIPGPGPVEGLASRSALIRPDARNLMRGQGFGLAQTQAFAPDAQRTALIKSKFANPAIRAIFPWWWWCCDDPNIVFSVSQNGNIILNENPATETRWCFEEGSSVTLVGNSDTSTVCHPKCPPPSGFVWTNVGGIDVSDIANGYAMVPAYAGGDYRDMAFAYDLSLYGQFAAGSNVSYYQVEAAQWVGDPARGGTAPAPGSGSPVAYPLDHTVYIYNHDGTFNSSASVRLGPFSQGGLINLYATPDARQNGPTPPGLLPFPAVPAGGSVYWDFQGLMLYTPSSNLIGGANTGAASLTVIGYDDTLTNVSLTPDDPLTLTIDNTGLTNAKINGITAWKSPGVPAPQTGTGDCPAYDVGPNGFVLIDVTVSDANGHLFEYYVDAEWGHGHSAAVTPPGVRGYVSNPLVIGSDPNYLQNSWVGGEEVMTFPGSTPGVAVPPVDCCYEFRIRAGKRVTNGYTYPSLADYDFWTINLKFSS